MSEIIADRYKIIKLIGRGGMAEVYLALDTILNRDVAVKVLKSDMSSDDVALERFRREASATTYLSHPNIVDVYDVGDDDNKHFIVMEYVNGNTLKQLIKKRGAIPYKEAVYYMKQLAGALMEAHRHNIIHRDVKSQNVIVKDDGTLKVADFGIALANGAMQITSEDSILGSVQYLAPELTKGVQATMQSDIYSLGIVFYELLTGKLPYQGDNAVKIALQHIKGEIPSVRKLDPEIPQAVEDIIIKSTAKSLDNRYSNVALMLKDLNECLSDEHANDKKIVLDQDLEEKTSSSIYVSDNANKSSHEIKEKKFEKRFAYIFLPLVVIFSCLLIYLTLLLAGVIGSKSKETVVPALEGLTIVEASDYLDSCGLNLDYSTIERILTSDVEAGKIISSSPKEGTHVERGAKIKIVVSDGIYEVFKDYTGKNIEEVKEELSKTNLIIQTRIQESDEAPGTIIAQEGIKAGEKFNPTSSTTVTFIYSEHSSGIIPFNTLGRGVEEVVKELEYEGFKVNLHKEDSSFFNEEELSKYSEGTVVRILPEEGSSYTQSEESAIEIYYY